MAVYSMVFIGTTPIGSLIVSSVATAGGVPLAFIVCGLPCVLAASYAAWLWRGSLGAAPVRAGAPVIAQPDPADTPATALPATPPPPPPVRLSGQPALRRP
jgi:hypothetical protein